MSVSYPNQYRNYCIIDLPRRRSLDEIKNSLENPKSEDTVVEDLYELNLMLDEGDPSPALRAPSPTRGEGDILQTVHHLPSPTRGEGSILQTTLHLPPTTRGEEYSGIKEEISKLYPILSKYNNTDSPNIQTFLAGIYRKIKVPDAFGPLIVMLIRNAVNNTTPHPNPTRWRGNEFFDPNEEIGGAILDYLV